MTRPDTTEYAPYYEKYISLVPVENILTTLTSQIDDTLKLLHGLSEAEGDLRYAPGKWSIKEVIGHLIDAERIFTYRALRMARSDRTPLPGFDENSYVENGNFGDRRMADLIDEFQTVRKSGVYIFGHLNADAWTRRGVANDSEVSVRAIAHILAGHERHHLGIIRTRYLGIN
jgi:DinB superfamily